MEFTQKRTLETPQDFIEYWDHEIREGRMTESVAAEKFSVLMLRGLKVSMTQGHAETEVVYTGITSPEMSDGKTSTYAGLGNPTGVKLVRAGEIFPEGELTHDRATIVNNKYGLTLRFTKEDVRRDRTGTLANSVSGLGAAMANFKDDHWATKFFNAAVAIYDGSNLFASNHPDVTGSGANSANKNTLSLGTVSHADLDSMVQTVSGWRGYNGEKLNASVKLLVVAPNQFQDAVRFTASSAHPVVDFSSGVTNVHSGLTVRQWSRLDATTWYGFTGIPGLVHQTEVPLALEREAANSGDNFLRDLTVTAKVSETWGAGVRDWRAVVKGA